MTADLHTHTTFSDGRLTPEELVEKAKNAGLKAIAVTDHDTVEGIDRALAAATIEVIPGVEITCDEGYFKDIHVLGLFIDHKNKELNELLNKAKRERKKQKEKIIANLQKFGVKITLDQVKQQAKGELTRLHVAEVAFKNNPGMFRSVDNVFRKLIGNDQQAYAERDSPTTLTDAISAIKAANGIAVIAHPGRYKLNHDALLSFFKANNGDAIETLYPYAKKYGISESESAELVKKFTQLAEQHSLKQSGGSDFHGKGEIELGQATIPYELVRSMRPQFERS